MASDVTYAALRQEMGVEVRPIDRLLDATTGDDHETVLALIGLLDAATELASKVDLPEKLASLRFRRALAEAEVRAVGTDRDEAERCWLGIGQDLATLKGHHYQPEPGPIDQEQCTLCLVMRHHAREGARYSWNGGTYFDIAYGRTDEPPCGGREKIENWLREGK